jgi:hypothetical protein
MEFSFLGFKNQVVSKDRKENPGLDSVRLEDNKQQYGVEWTGKCAV